MAKECLLFMGRWCPFHKGHVAMIEEVLKDHPSAELLLLVKDSDYDPISAKDRKIIVEMWLEESGIPGRVIIIPDATGIYYGRSVGYEVRKVELSSEMEDISATKIRQMIRTGDDSWKDIVASPSIVPLIEKVLG